MSVTRVGSTQQFADNWENIFGGSKKATKKTSKAGSSNSKKAAKKSSKTKATAKKKATGKKPAKKKGK